MRVDGGVERPRVVPPLPRSIWVIAWASLAGQVLLVVRHGGRVGDDVSQVVSMVLGALLVGYVSAGVARALVGALGGYVGLVDAGLTMNVNVSGG